MCCRNTEGDEADDPEEPLDHGAWLRGLGFRRVRLGFKV